MILVVLGAGASYDSCPAKPAKAGTRAVVGSRPPLAAELFLDHDIVRKTLQEFPECHAIVPYLQHVPPHSTLERELERLQTESETDPERKRQLAALRCYLQTVISRYEEGWNSITCGMTNHVTLLDQLRRVRGDQTVCLVTFNYDTMMEQALRSGGVSLVGIDDYVTRDDFQLYKLHGSVNWGRAIATNVNVKPGLHEVRQEIIRRAAELEVTDQYCVVEEQPVAKLKGTALFPAVAIPVENKNEFECPAAHLLRLEAQLGDVSKVLLIGWRGAEQHFLDLLRRHLRRTVPVCAVAGDHQQAEEVLARLKAGGLTLKGTASEGGFTRFTVQREAERFLAS